MKTHVWKTDCQNNNYENLLNVLNVLKKGSQSFILDMSKTHFDIVEKYAYDLAKHHFDRLNLDISEKCVHFYYNFANKFNISCNEQSLLSCISYFNTCDFPTIITQVTHDDYKFKNFKEKHEIQLIFPEKNKHITFDRTFFHGSFSQSYFEDALTFSLDLLDVKPTNAYYYNNTNENENIFTKEPKLFGLSYEENQFNIIENKDEKFDHYFYESMLYNNTFALDCDIMTAIFNGNFYNKNFIIRDVIDNPNLICKIKILKTFNKIKDEEIIKINRISEEQNKINFFFKNTFDKKFLYEGIYTKNECDWIIMESEKYASKNNGWNANSYIYIDKISSIFNFCLCSFNDIFNKIVKTYCLSDSVRFNIFDIFIVKNGVDLNNDKSVMNINVSLNDNEVGGIQFDNGITTFLNQGDMIVYSSKSAKVSNNKKGYMLIAFIYVTFSKI